jgi:hypothetical protein
MKTQIQTGPVVNPGPYVFACVSIDEISNRNKGSFKNLVTATKQRVEVSSNRNRFRSARLPRLADFR